ncbi:MAG TPA: hypothetical protein VK629_20090 [Steroidobacteraceae bacterium]|nr:hypothetical protein [Steroidobacteraceae bacterium]
MGYTRGENEFSSEFYRVDYCCYSFEMLKEGMVTWDLELAIEHENNGRSWHEEWIKLASFNCGLRVVISYAHEIDSISPESPALAKAEILASRRKYAQDAGKWLLILGAAYRESMTTCHFVAFSFDEGGFVKLPDSPIQPSVPSVGPPGPS